MYRRLLNELEVLSNANMSSVRFAAAGSAPVTVDLLEDFKRVFGVEVIEGYGLTEGGPNVLCMPRWGINRLGSLGLPLPGCDVQLRDLSGEREIERGEVGELWVRNPGVTPGYHGLPEVTAERIRDGWLATRDLMRQDEDGYFYFVGRTDDLIIVSGEQDRRGYLGSAGMWRSRTQRAPGPRCGSSGQVASLGGSVRWFSAIPGSPRRLPLACA